MEIKHYQYKVIGKVQGVWFRKYTKEKAITLGLKGFVRNVNDGSVEVHALGVETSLISFEKWLYDGSPLSKVETVIKQEMPLASYHTFSINHG